MNVQTIPIRGKTTTTDATPVRKAAIPLPVRIPARSGQPFRRHWGGHSDSTGAAVPVTGAAVPTALGQRFR
jgi:hypothetical protein